MHIRLECKMTYLIFMVLSRAPSCHLGCQCGRRSPWSKLPGSRSAEGVARTPYTVILHPSQLTWPGDRAVGRCPSRHVELYRSSLLDIILLFVFPWTRSYLPSTWGSISSWCCEGSTMAVGSKAWEWLPWVALVLFTISTCIGKRPKLSHWDLGTLFLKRINLSSSMDK